MINEPFSKHESQFNIFFQIKVQMQTNEAGSKTEILYKLYLYNDRHLRFITQTSCFIKAL